MRRTAFAVAVATLSLVGVACEPAPPPPMFQVTSTATGADAAPGDGVCETEADNGVCTITAAVQEGNALGRAIIDVPVNFDTAVESLLAVPVITGDITLRSTFTRDNGAIGAAAEGGLEIDAGATLKLEHFHIVVRDGLSVRGRMVSDSSVVAATIDIEQGGTVIGTNSMLLDIELVGSEDSVVTNHGVLLLMYSDLISGQALLHTSPSGRTIMGASKVHGPEGALACTGKPVEDHGYNTDLAMLSDGESCFAEWVEPLDAIPYGELGCGTGMQEDNLGQPRPADDDGDGIARCDVGSRETRN